MKKHSLKKATAIVLIATAIAGLTGCGIDNSKPLSREERAEYLKLKGQVAAQVNKDETSNLIKETESSEVNIENLTPETYGNFIKFYKNYKTMDTAEFKSNLDSYKSIMSDEIYDEMLNDYNENGKGYVKTENNSSSTSETLPDTVYLCRAEADGMAGANCSIIEGKNKGDRMTVPHSVLSSVPNATMIVVYLKSNDITSNTYGNVKYLEPKEIEIEKVEEYNSSSDYNFYSDDKSSNEKSNNTVAETTTAEETLVDAAEANKSFRIDSCESYSNVVLVKGTINSNTTLFKLTLDNESRVTKIEKFTIDTGKGNTKK